MKKKSMRSEVARKQECLKLKLIKCMLYSERKKTTTHSHTQVLYSKQKQHLNNNNKKIFNVIISK